MYMLKTLVTMHDTMQNIGQFQAPYTGLILGLCPANGRRRYFVTTSLIGWVQT